MIRCWATNYTTFLKPLGVLRTELRQFSGFMGLFPRLSSVVDPRDQISLQYPLQCFRPHWAHLDYSVSTLDQLTFHVPDGLDIGRRKRPRGYAHSHVCRLPSQYTFLKHNRHTDRWYRNTFNTSLNS